MFCFLLIHFIEDEELKVWLRTLRLTPLLRQTICLTHRFFPPRWGGALSVSLVFVKLANDDCQFLRGEKIGPADRQRLGTVQGVEKVSVRSAGSHRARMLNVVISLYSVATLALCSSGHYVILTLKQKSVSDPLHQHPTT